jgi:hypothetical protein
VNKHLRTYALTASTSDHTNDDDYKLMSDVTDEHRYAFVPICYFLTDLNKNVIPHRTLVYEDVESHLGAHYWPKYDGDYAFPIYESEGVNPLDYSNSDPEDTDTANATSLDITDTAHLRKFTYKMPIFSRAVYLDGGSQTLYGYYRYMYFDPLGHWLGCGAETRYTIDAPELCE